jgi:hypothetical protein
MALDTAPKIYAKRLLAGKLETTTGTAISVSASDCVDYVLDPEMAYEFETIDVPPQGGTLSPTALRVGARSGTCSFGLELAGDAVAPPAWFKYMQACGMTLSTATLTPNSAATETITLAVNRDGRQKTLAGCMGSWEMLLEAGKHGRVNFNFMGVPQPVVDGTIWAPTYNTVIPPNVSAAAITIGAATYVIDQINISSGNNVMLRKSLTAVDSASAPTGNRAAYITGRRITVRVSPESLPLATKDWNALFTAQTSAALSVVVGTAANNIFTITAPKMVLARHPAEAERDGLMVDELEFVCLRNTSVDDEFQIVAS